MNKFKFYFILLVTTASIFSCSKDDDDYTSVPLRDYAEQYKADSITINTYLKSYYITVTEAPGQTTDQDIVMTKIPDGGTQSSIMSLLDSPTLPSLKTKTVTKHNIEYTLYYLVLREGIGESPCNIDGVLSSYRGDYLYDDPDSSTDPSGILAAKFEESVYPDTYFDLYYTITGWGETFPEFKTGTYDFTTNPDKTISYKDFGAGVMFLPSGLAYYNKSSTTFPSYSPLIFSFKLYDIERLDHDGDQVPSYLEDLDGDGYIRTYSTLSTDSRRYDDDTDHDGIPDAFDIDDDGDNYTTKLEIQYTHPEDPYNIIRYYPYEGVATDNPNTLYTNENQGIPGYINGIINYTDPSRLRIHVDKNYH